eukprot:6182263-Pleurochrysis_carterae.AAC.1
MVSYGAAARPSRASPELPERPSGQKTSCKRDRRRFNRQWYIYQPGLHRLEAIFSAVLIQGQRRQGAVHGGRAVVSRNFTEDDGIDMEIYRTVRSGSTVTSC